MPCAPPATGGEVMAHRGPLALQAASELAVVLAIEARGAGAQLGAAPRRGTPVTGARRCGMRGHP